MPETKDKKYEGMKAVSDWIKNCPSEEFMKTFNELKDDYSGPTIGDFLGDADDEPEEPEEPYDINQDFREFLEKLKQLDNNIADLIWIYECILLNDEKDYKLVDDTSKLIKQCIKNIESLSFLRDKD